MVTFLLKILVLSISLVTISAEEECSKYLWGRTVNIETDLSEWEGYWLTFSKIRNIYISYDYKTNVEDPNNGYSWLVYPCNNYSCFKTLYPGWENYYLNANELTYVSREEALDDMKHLHYEIICDNCNELENCVIKSEHNGCQFGHSSTSSYTQCSDDVSSKWNIVAKGGKNGLDSITIDEIANCSPGGGVMTKTIEYEVGTSSSDTSSHTHSVGVTGGAGGEGKLVKKIFDKFNLQLSVSYGYEYSTSHTNQFEERRKTSITVNVQPGHIASVFQTKAKIGHITIQTHANYTDKFCHNHMTENPTISENIILLNREENCSPGASEIPISIKYKQGLADTKNLWHLQENSQAINVSLLEKMKDAIKNSTETELNHKNIWLQMDFNNQFIPFDKNVEYTAGEGVKLQQGKVLNIKQLILLYQNFIGYSSIVWPQFEDCSINETIPEPQTQPLLKGEILPHDHKILLKRLENCGQGVSDVPVGNHYKQGIINNEFPHVPVSSDTVNLIKDMLRNSKILIYKSDWDLMDIDQLGEQSQTSVSLGESDIRLPPGQVISIYQLVFQSGDIMVYSEKIWTDFENCKKPTNYLLLGGIVGSGVLVAILVIIVFVFRKQCQKCIKNTLKNSESNDLTNPIVENEANQNVDLSVNANFETVSEISQTESVTKPDSKNQS